MIVLAQFCLSNSAFLLSNKIDAGFYFVGHAYSCVVPIMNHYCRLWTSIVVHDTPTDCINAKGSS